MDQKRITFTPVSFQGKMLEWCSKGPTKTTCQQTADIKDITTIIISDNYTSKMFRVLFSDKALKSLELQDFSCMWACALLNQAILTFQAICYIAKSCARWCTLICCRYGWLNSCSAHRSFDGLPSQLQGVDQFVNCTSCSTASENNSVLFSSIDALLDNITSKIMEYWLIFSLKCENRNNPYDVYNSILNC